VTTVRLARVVGHVVSTIKDQGYAGQSMQIIQFVDRQDNPEGPRVIAFNCADAGVGDRVLVNVDGGAANMFLGDQCIADLTICGVVDDLTFHDEGGVGHG
jgi:microcompartment protein CcmK/EutM